MHKTLIIVGIVLLILGIVLFFSNSFSLANSVNHSFHFTTIYLTPKETYNITINKETLFMYNSTMPITFYGSSLKIVSGHSVLGFNTLVLEPTTTPGILYIHNNNTVTVIMSYDILEISSSFITSGLIIFGSIILGIIGLIILIVGIIKR